MLWIIAIVSISVFIYAFGFKPNRKLQTLHKYKTFPEMVIATADYFRERTYPQTRNLVSNEQAEAENFEKNNLIQTIELASAGSYPHRKILIEETMSFLMSSAFNIERIEDLSCVSFINAKQMTPNEKFEVMLYYTQKDLEEEMREAGTFNEDSEGQFQAFYVLMQKFGITEKPRPLRTNPKHAGIYITDHDIDYYFDFFMSERVPDGIALTDAIAITATLIVPEIFGFNKVDSLVYQSIDEIQLGVAGTEVGSKRHIASPLNSTFVVLKNKKIRLQFLRFDSIKQLENTIVSLAEHGEDTFTPKDGYKYTTLLNLRRVTARRPPVADFMSVNIRKLATSGPTNADLLKMNPVPIYGVDMVEEFLQLFAWANMSGALSGGQGSGKSSHMNAYRELLGPDNAVRALGNIDESRFKDREPEFDTQHYFKTSLHNIHNVSGLMKRTNGDYMMLMEVLTSEDAQEAINNFTSGYRGGIVSTHSPTPEDLVKYFAQLLSNGQATSSESTQYLVANVISTFIGVQKAGDIYGFNQISEISPRNFKPRFEEVDEDDPTIALAKNNKLFQEQSLDRSMFEVRRLIGFDREINAYFADEPPSVFYLTKMYKGLSKEYHDVFFGFFRKYYNINVKQMLIESGEIVTKKAGV